MKTYQIPNNNNVKFSQVFDSDDNFLEEWKDSGIYEEDLIEDKSIKKIFFLLYARYGNSTISSEDINQFKYKVWSIIYEYAPTWQKRLEIQKTLRKMNEEEIMQGSKTIMNVAQNPSMQPSTNTTEEINTINGQNVSKYKKSKLEGYTTLIALLEEDVTHSFIERFKKLFCVFVDIKPPLFVTED